MSSKNQDLIDTLSKSWIIIFNDNVAVALKYDEGVDLAPVIVAKDKGELALQIQVNGHEKGIPVVHNAYVAESLYSSSEIGQCIPDQLYAYVAQIVVVDTNILSKK